MSIPVSNARDRAFAEGAAFGRTLANKAGSCPYGHGEIALRLAWMDGFGTHRPYRIEHGLPAGRIADEA